MSENKDRTNHDVFYDVLSKPVRKMYFHRKWQDKTTPYLTMRMQSHFYTKEAKAIHSKHLSAGKWSLEDFVLELSTQFSILYLQNCRPLHTVQFKKILGYWTSIPSHYILRQTHSFLILFQVLLVNLLSSTPSLAKMIIRASSSRQSYKGTSKQQRHLNPKFANYASASLEN